MIGEMLYTMKIFLCEYIHPDARAMLAARALRAKLVVPMHYNTFPVIEQNAAFFSNQLLNYGVLCQVLNPEDGFDM